jgi:PadR family transcriptional regulator AphA
MKDLSTHDWAVLAFLSEGKAHGFKVAAAFDKRQLLGNVWYVQRPQVYRSLGYLQEEGLVKPLKPELGNTGPPKLCYQITKQGQSHVAMWLSRPVEHLREGRSELLLKLLFMQRQSKDTQSFLEQQRNVFQQIQAGLLKLIEDAGEDKKMILLWRLSMARAAVAFIDELM